MAKPSPHFARIKADVLAITAAIPAGRLCSFKAIGDHLDVMPRHVAYILATLRDPLDSVIPWHRVVSEAGQLSKGNGRAAQEALLAEEGVSVDRHGHVTAFESHFVPVEKLLQH
jgi:methylated-DNA-protein-cysteine methyltransferase related protein